MMKPTVTLTALGEKINLSALRSRISWTRSARVAAPSMRLTRYERGLKEKSWSYRLPWKKPKVYIQFQLTCNQSLFFPITGTLEQEENKVLRSQLELTQVKQEIERRIKEKCDELDALKKTYQKSIESMQASLENETRAKGEAIRQKKKLEADMK